METLETQGFVIPENLPEFFAQYGTGLLTFGAWLLGGLIMDRIIRMVLVSNASRSDSKLLTAVARASQNLAVWIASIIGFWIAYFQTPLPAAVNRDLSMYLKLASVAIATMFLARLASNLLAVYIEREDTRLPASSIFENLVRWTIYVIGLGALLAVAGVSVTPILTALGVGGLAVGLALQPTLDNLFSGIQILASRQIEPGDYVRLETGEEGTVEDVTWRNTTIRRKVGDLVIVPNGLIGRSSVINFSRSNQAYSSHVITTVRYGTDPVLLEKIALEVADGVMNDAGGAYKGGEPAFWFNDITTNGISFTTAIPTVSYEQQWDARSMFIERLQARLTAEGIEPAQPMAAVPPA